MTELNPQMLRINVTTNIAIDAPKKASDEELARAVSLAQLSKDAGIGNLTWDHTTEALGASAVTEDKVETEVIEPDPDRRVSWKAIVMPIIAGTLCFGFDVPVNLPSLNSPAALVYSVNHSGEPDVSEDPKESRSRA